MGVNLVTRVRGFYVQTRTFTAADHDVQDGCVTPGNHRLLRFDFLSYNAGDADLVVGSPAARPDLFVWSSGHGHYHLKDFNEFLLFAANGTLATVGYKQAFCAIDIERISPTASAAARFGDCNSNQGISAGWADVYSSGLACQFVVIDGVPDGDYTLQSTTNTRHVVGEDCFADNTIWTGLRLQGNTVTVIDPPFVPEDRIPFNRANVAAVQAGGRWKVAEGNHWMLDTGSSQWEAQRAVEIINHYRLASMCFVGRPRCGGLDPMMYWLNNSGRAPTGQLAGEDCLPFDRDNLTVVEIGGRWKVVDDTHWLLDFGAGEGNAVAALHFIRKYGFDQVCYVGRPGPSMTYFKRNPRGHLHIDWIDPRRLEASLDRPRWWELQAQAVQDVAPYVDLTADQPGFGPDRRAFDPFEVEVRGADGEPAEQSEIADRYGITGLVLGAETEIRPARPADVVDIGLVHFGEPPSIVAYAGRKEAGKIVADPGQRQIENLRLVGSGIDRVIIVAPASEGLLTHVRLQPSVVKKPRARGKKAG